MAVDNSEIRHRTIDTTQDWRPDSAKVADSIKAYADIYKQYTQPLAKGMIVPKVNVSEDQRLQVQQRIQQLTEPLAGQQPFVADPYSRIFNAETNGQPASEAKRSFLEGLTLPSPDLAIAGSESAKKATESLTHGEMWQTLYDDTIGSFLKNDAMPWFDDQIKGAQASMRLTNNPETQINVGESAKQAGQALALGPFNILTAPNVANRIEAKPGASQQTQQDIAAYQKAGQQQADLARNAGALASALIAAPVVGGAEVAGVTLGQVGQVGMVGLGVVSLPDALKATLEEVKHPSDQNMAHAILNVGNSWIQLAPPIRGLTGLRSLSQIAGDQMVALKAAKSDEHAIHALLQTSDMDNQHLVPLISGHSDWLEQLRGPNMLRPIEQLVDEVPQGSENLLSYVESKNLDLESPNVKNLISAEHHKEALYNSLKEAVGNDPVLLAHPEVLKQVVPQVMAALDDFKEEVWMPARMNFAHEFGLLANDKKFPFPMEMPMDERKIYDELDYRHRSLMGVVRGFAEYGTQAQAPGTTAISAAQSGEAALRGIAGPLKSATNEISVARREFANKLKIPDERMKAITLSLDDPAAFEKLSAPERVMGRLLMGSFAVHTNARLVSEDIALAASGYVPRKVVYEKGSFEAASDPTSQAVHSVIGDEWVNHKNWLGDLDAETGHISVYDAAKPQIQWLEEETARSGRYAAGTPLRAAYSKNQDFINEQRQALGAAKSHITKTQNRLDSMSDRHRELESQLIPELQVRQQELQLLLHPLKGVKGAAAAREPILAEITAAEKQLKKHARELTGLSKSASVEYQKLIDRKAILESRINDIRGTHGDEIAHLIGTHNNDLKKVLNARPGGRTLLSGWDLIDYADRRFALDMHRATFRRDLLSLAHNGVDKLNEWYPGTKGEFLGNQLIAGKLKPHDHPEVLLGTVFRDEKEAVAAGYRQVLGEVGKQTDLNHQPAVFVRQDIADPMLKEMQSATTIDQINKAWRIAYMPVHIGKRAIFVSPAWHAENVAGRAVAQLIDQPALGNAALGKLIKARFSDPAQLSYLKTEAYLHGMVPAHRYQVSHQLARMRGEAHGMISWPGVLRTMNKNIPHPYNDIFEKGFWKAVDDVGLIKYMIEDARMAIKRPDIPAKVRKYAAAEAANNLSGMVNPAYMNKAWRFLRGIASFAPSYWATMVRSAEASIMTKTPYASRLGYYLASHGHEGMTPVRLRQLDFQHWRETARAQASWFDTYMAATLVTYDMMNMIGSGHHLWENDEGRYTDIQMDNFFHPHEMASGTRHVYASGGLGFKQGADILNAVGFGHQWGLAHLMGDKEFEEAGAMQKIGMATNAFLEGAQREGSSKVGMMPQAMASIAGFDLTTLLRDKQVQEVPKIAALTSFIPGGYQVRQWMHDSEQASKGGRPVSTADELSGIGKSLVSQVTGFPSLYWMGGEAPNKISDEKWVNYNQSKAQFQQEALSDWKQVINAQMDLRTWQQQRQRRIDKTIQLDGDTFGDSTPSGTLSKKHHELQEKWKLDDPTMSQEDFYNNLDNFEAEWESVLAQSSPETNAIWWDNVHKQWTDGDYLYWYTRQMKQALASQVDGQGGKHIQQVNAKYSRYYASYDAATVEQAKEADPYYNVYHALLKQIGKDSPMGAMISAFTSSYGARVVPPGLTPEQEQQYLESLPSGTPAFRGSSLAGLGAQAKGAAEAPVTRAAGGQLSATLPMRQQISQLIQQAGGEVAADATDEQLLADLQGVLNGG